MNSRAATPSVETERYDWRKGLWLYGAILAALGGALPVLVVIGVAFFPSENIWPHLFGTMLPRYVKNTGLLMAGVAVGTFLIGVSTAWLVTMCRFPGRRILEWALLLPMAVPAYIVAYTYTDLLEYAGPVQGALRDLFGWQTPRDYWFPEIRSLGGGIAMLSLALYPYVYMMARAAFLSQSVCALEASRVLGRGPWHSFFTVALPMARPAIVAGIVVALMETLSDFGTIDYFGVHTLTAGIFNVWLNMGNIGGAAQIAATMLMFVVVLIGIERHSRRRQRYHNAGQKMMQLPGFKLSPTRQTAALVACLLPIIAGFVIPVGVLSLYAVQYFDVSWNPRFAEYARNSLAVSGAAVCLTVLMGLFLAYAQRLNDHPILRYAVRTAATGYAVPGAVLAIGVIIPFAWFDNTLDAWMRQTFDVSTGLLLSGSIAALVFAFSVRFLAVAHGSIEASLGKVRPHLDDASRTLGASAMGTLVRVHFPLIRGGILVAAVLVFVDSMKELPATLILRPFNFDTLATYVYQFASDELLEECALGALTIVVTGIIPVILLSRAVSASRPGHGAQERDDDLDAAAPLTSLRE